MSSSVQKPQKMSRHAQKLVGLVVELDLLEITAYELLSHKGQGFYRAGLLQTRYPCQEHSRQSYARSRLQRCPCQRNNSIVPVTQAKI